MFGLKTYFAKEVFKDKIQLGHSKPMGNLPNKTLVQFKTDIPAFSWALKQKGLSVLAARAYEYSCVSLYVYHEPSLKKLLDDNRQTLIDADWPTDCVGFIKKVNIDHVPAKTKLFDLVADAFGDKMNSGRTQPPTITEIQKYKASRSLLDKANDLFYPRF